MRIEAFVKRHLLQRSPLSLLLYPFSLIYASIQTQRRSYYLKKAHRFDKPIISIGNIVSGGSGKTPLTIYLAELLVRHGCKPAISHRGYKGAYESFPTLISDRQHVFSHAIEAGDEAYLLATNLKGIPVVVGKHRKASIGLLLSTFKDLDVIILDDSFQHLAVHHDLDIIAFNAEIGLGNGFVIPAGYLREPISSIASKHIAVINKKLYDSDGSDLKIILKDRTTNIFCTKMSFTGFYNSSHELQTEMNPKKCNVISICGIANPDSFDIMLNSYGFHLKKSFHYLDHYDYNDIKEVQQLVNFTHKHSIDLILTTEKDIMKIRKHQSLAKLAVYPKLGMEFEDEARFFKLLTSVLR